LAATVDTSTWKTYTDKTSKLNFKYPSTWKVLAPTTKNGYTVIQVDPGTKYYNIKIYVSSRDYYIMGGLPTKPVSIGSYQGIDVSDLLYGVVAHDLYYTFDIGQSLSLKDKFNALVRSVSFN